MDHVEWALAQFDQRRRLSAISKIDALLNIEEIEDPRVLPFLLHVAADTDELPEVRSHVIRTMRTRDLAADARVPVARVVGTILVGDPSSIVRAQCALALAEFTDSGGVTRMLGTVALDDSEPLDVRYSAFMSLERTGPRPECVEVVQQLSVDETFGRSAPRLLSMWDLP
jgi:HEAT repeat protein